MERIVRVIVSGGVVQHVEVPEGVRVIVNDYDCEGCDPAVLEYDDNGDPFVEVVWVADCSHTPKSQSGNEY
jgi:hypothetical protein